MPIHQQCRDVLVEKNLSMLSASQSTRLFLLQMINEDTYNQVQHKAKAKSDYFSGSYTKFKEHRESEKRLSSTQVSEDEALSALTLNALPDAVNAWRDCMVAHKAGFFCWLEGDPEGTIFNLKLQWEPPVGLGGKPLERVRESISAENGNAKFEEDIPSTLNPGEHTFGVKRTGKNVAVWGRINAIAGTHNFTISFFIPPTPLGLQEDPYYISDFPSDLLQEGNVHGKLQFNRVYWSNNQVWIDGIHYEKAIGMHAPLHGTAFAEFRIPKGARYFRSIFGLAREDAHPNTFGRVTGRVFIDKHSVWSATVAGPDAVQTGVIGIPQGADVLRLEVDSLGDNSSDHATWANPYFSTV